MRRVLVLVAALAIGGFGASALSGSAEAGPLPSVSPIHTSLRAVEKIGYWKRYCRRYGCGPDVVVGDDLADTYVVPPVVGVAPPVVVVPLRPASCGEFRYWNGFTCVDARYNKTYVGPRQ